MMTQQRIRALEQEVGRLKATVAELQASRCPPPPVQAPAFILEDYVRNRASIHPSQKPKKTKKNQDMIKGLASGACLTTPELIAALAAQESAIKEKEAAVAKAKQENAARRKEERQRKAAENKKRKAEQQASDRKEKEEKEAEEKVKRMRDSRE
jgi:hypothetical protein